MITTTKAPRRWQVPCPQELLVQRTGNPGPFKSLLLPKKKLDPRGLGLSLAASGTNGGGYSTRIDPDRVRPGTAAPGGAMGTPFQDVPPAFGRADGRR